MHPYCSSQEVVSSQQLLLLPDSRLFRDVDVAVMTAVMQ
jgi:hypothetical protein